MSIVVFIHALKITEYKSTANKNLNIVKTFFLKLSFGDWREKIIS